MSVPLAAIFVGCGDDPLRVDDSRDIDDPDLLNGAWVGTSVVTVYDPDTGTVVCGPGSFGTAVACSSLDLKTDVLNMFTIKWFADGSRLGESDPSDAACSPGLGPGIVLARTSIPEASGHGLA